MFIAATLAAVDPGGFVGAEVWRHTVAAEDSGLRFDQVLALRHEELSRTLARKLVDLGGAHLDGRRLRKCGQVVTAGQKIELFRDGAPLEPFTLEEGDILFRDKWLLAVAKPAGVETQPTPARYRGTLYAALLDFLHNPFRPLDRPSLGMVQRLDRDTSGVMVFSIHPRAHKELTACFTAHRVEKLYLALVQGVVGADSGEFRSLLARSRNGNRVKSVPRGGKEAVTCFRVLERFPAATLVEVQILTGRTHQIRVHFAEAGHSLLGDRLYGVAASEPRRQMLHALRLTLPHPVTGTIVALEAPLPADMQTVLQHLRSGEPIQKLPAF